MVRTGHPKAARVGPRGLFVGLATLDVVHRVERLPEVNEKITALRDEGLVASVFYSAFQIAPGSAVAAAPETYGITAIRYPRGSDLNPPAVDFEGPGMTRQRAFSLCQEFSARLQERSLPGGRSAPDRVDLAGRTISLAFPLRRVAERIRRYAPPHLDFFSFIGRGNEAAPPLMRP